MEPQEQQHQNSAPLNARKSLSGHQSASMLTDQWVTPRSIVQPLGEFDLDPCSFKGHPWPIARRCYTERENGLTQRWFGRVWLNPPFGQRATAWMERMALHGNGIALIAARTETRMFFEWVWDWADAILFMRGRPHFCYANGTPAPFNSGAPIVLIAYGERNGRTLESSGIAGRLLWLKTLPLPPRTRERSKQGLK